MNQIFSMNFWVSIIVSTFFTMCCFYAMKKLTAKVDIPVVSEIVQNA